MNLAERNCKAIVRVPRIVYRQECDGDIVKRY